MGDVFPHLSSFFLYIVLRSFEGSALSGSGGAISSRLPGIWSGQLGVFLVGHPSVGIAECRQHIGGILGQNYGPAE